LAVNLALTLLQDTPADAGTVSAVLLDESAMVAPPVGAPVLSLTVHAADAPDASVVGVQVKDPSAGPVETGAVGVGVGVGVAAGAVSAIEAVFETLL
jgi:hypothetical protein